MSKSNPNSNDFRTMLHIVKSHDHAKAGMIAEAEKHRDHAHQYFASHITSLTQSHRHEEAKEFTDHITPYFKKLDQVIDLAKSHAGSSFGSFFNKKKKLFKADALEKGITIVKGISPPKISTTINVDRQPGKDSRYDYKPFHELKHDDQIRAGHAFQSKDMGAHHYPVDKGSGEFVHGATRWLQPKAAQSPTAMPADHGTSIAPQHRAGAAVRIHDEGHPMHGKLGIVKPPNPNMPGKIPVQVGSQSHQVEHFAPGQVKLSEGQTRNVGMVNLLQRSKSVLKSLRSKD